MFDRNNPSALQARVAELEGTVRELRERLAVSEASLNSVLGSRGWRMLNRFRDARARLLRVAPLRLAARALRRRLDGSPDNSAAYQLWIKNVETPTRDPETIRTALASLSYRPKISIVMPVFKTPPVLLDAAIDSVRSQFYDNWELCICDDGSESLELRGQLQKWCKRDARIKAVLSETNQGISAASNRALETASGEFIGLLDHDDELSPDALLQNVRLLQVHSDADMIYSDEDKIDLRGKRSEPFFKPDWSPEHFLSCMYTCHFGVYRRSVVQQIGGFRVGFEGSQDYDLVLRISQQTDRIFHIPKILYHWRTVTGSAATTHDAKPQAALAAKKALAEHLDKQPWPARVRAGRWAGHYRVDFEVDSAARVSIIIPSRNQAAILQACIESIEEKTRYLNYEIIVIDNQSNQPQAIEYLASLRHRVLRFPEPFNFSRIVNFGARSAAGNFLLFLNNDMTVISPDWLEAMLGYCQQKAIGAVGAKLLYPTDRIQHAGVVLGVGGIAGHAMKSLPRNTKAQFGIAGDVRNYSAVTGACMMVRKEVFDEVHGFDENLPVAFNDVDFCLRVREAGYRIVFTPYAELYHFESASRGYSLRAQEIAYVQRRWGGILRADPYYNPNLSLQHEDFRLCVAPRSSDLDELGYAKVA